MSYDTLVANITFVVNLYEIGYGDRNLKKLIVFYADKDFQRYRGLIIKMIIIIWNLNKVGLTVVERLD